MPEEHKSEPFLMKRLILEITESKHLSRSIKASFPPFGRRLEDDPVSRRTAKVSHKFIAR